MEKNEIEAALELGTSTAESGLVSAQRSAASSKMEVVTTEIASEVKKAIESGKLINYFEKLLFAIDYGP
jgi:hypothetical protein